MRHCVFVLLLLAAGAAAARQVPAWLLEVPPSVDEILVADAATATLRRFVNNGHGIEQLDTRYMSIGKKGVGKERAWDRRTPLGIYFITEELDTSRLHDKYGDRAFVLDYPNAWDRRLRRTGDGIWLHGVDRNDPERPPLDTDGCLALPNEAINALAPELDPLVTPVIVTREFEWVDEQDVISLRAELRAALARWQESVSSGDVPGYLANYARDFRPLGLSREDWAEWRRSVFAARGASPMTIDDLLLVADPETEGLYLSRFRQRLEVDGRTVSTRKRLYWQRADGGQWRIVAEDNG